MVESGGGAPAKLVSELEALLGLWRRRYGARPIPERSRFDAFELDPWARHIAWIEAGPGDTFRVRGFGIELIRRFGREATNESIDDLALDIASGMREALWKTMATAAPVATEASVQLGRQAARFSELILPLARDPKRISLFLLASYEVGTGSG